MKPSSSKAMIILGWQKQLDLVNSSVSKNGGLKYWQLLGLGDRQIEPGLPAFPWQDM